MEKDKEYMSIEELCDTYGVSRATVYNWRKEENGIPYVKMGKRLIRFKKEEVEEWMRKRV